MFDPVSALILFTAVPNGDSAQAAQACEYAVESVYETEALDADVTTDTAEDRTDVTFTNRDGAILRCSVDGSSTVTVWSSV